MVRIGVVLLGVGDGLWEVVLVVEEGPEDEVVVGEEE